MTTKGCGTPPATQVEKVRDYLLVGFSWLIVLAIGLMPIAEAVLDRSPSITMPAKFAFFITVGSAILLRRSYTWLDIVLHIYGQIAIWLSIFTISLAVVLFVVEKA